MGGDEGMTIMDATPHSSLASCSFPSSSSSSSSSLPRRSPPVRRGALYVVPFVPVRREPSWRCGACVCERVCVREDRPRFVYTRARRRTRRSAAEEVRCAFEFEDVTRKRAQQREVRAEVDTASGTEENANGHAERSEPELRVPERDYNGAHADERAKHLRNGASVHLGKFDEAHISTAKRPLTSEEEAELAQLAQKLLPRVQYLHSVNCTKVNQALRVAFIAHRDQRRKSGELFVTHPVEVAILLAELGMDVDTICAGLLHDTVEDTPLTFEEIENMFGRDVRKIVEGETKVSKLPQMAEQQIADDQAENLRQMFICFAEDWRIIVVKLCDRLHNMRTLQYMKPHKQTKISRETLEIFGPLAHRLGMWSIKSELEQLAFFYLYPEEYKKIEELVNEKKPKYVRILEESKARLEEALAKNIVLSRVVKRIEVRARIKDLYSVWRKMQMDGKNLEQVHDLVALRVVIEPLPTKHAPQSAGSDGAAAPYTSPREVARQSQQRANPPSTAPPVASEADANVRPRIEADSSSGQQAQRHHNSTSGGESLCYYVLGVVHGIWQPFPGRVKDYIAFPKRNAYRALHTTVMAGGAQAPLEVQIRTLDMHRVAEYGMAAHWLYKKEAAEMYMKKLQEGKQRRKGADVDFAEGDDGDDVEDEDEFEEMDTRNASVTARTPAATARSQTQPAYSDVTSYPTYQNPQYADFGTTFLDSIREWQKEIYSSREFVEVVRREILGNRVFIFAGDDAEIGTKKILSLPRGATVVDAAVSMGMNVAKSMIAARVNGRMVPMVEVLHNADMFSVITSPCSPGPDKRWIEYASTRLAKTRLKLYFRDQRKARRIEQGRQILMEYLQLECSVGEDLDVDMATLNDYVSSNSGLQFDTVDDLFLRLATANSDEKDSIFASIGKSFGKSASPVNFWGSLQAASQSCQDGRFEFLSDRESKGFGSTRVVQGQLASCCLPVFGDSVCTLSGATLVAAAEQQRATKPVVHRMSCHYAQTVQDKSADIILKLDWVQESGDSKTHGAPSGHQRGRRLYRSCLRVTCYDRKGLLADVSASINRLKIMIDSTESRTVGTRAYLQFRVLVATCSEVEAVMRSISEVPSVLSVER